MDTSKQKEETEMLSRLMRAPLNMGMKVLDREAFTKRIPTVAAYVLDKRDIQRARKAAASVMLYDPLGRTTVFSRALYRETVKEDEYALPLSPSVKPDVGITMPSDLLQLVEEGRVKLVPTEGKLVYNNFNSDEILKAIMPPDETDGVQHGFTLIGHIAQVNLRDEWLDFKQVIADVIIDKNPTVKTVIRKIEDVGAVSEFRTFPMEVVAGEPLMNVSLKSTDCTFEFDFSKVYWNTRLENEHLRIANLAKPGDAVCDVMAGVGPFAIPAAKKNRALVWANDLNPDCFAAMKHNINLNRVRGLVQAFNSDGREFIKKTSESLIRDGGKKIEYDPNPKSVSRDPKLAKRLKPIETYTIPKVFSRYIMNLPASAVEFLDAFIGLYAGKEALFENPARPQLPDEEPRYKLPIIHVYTFNRNRPYEDEIEAAGHEICDKISRYLQYPMSLDYVEDIKDEFVTGEREPNRHPQADIFVEGKAKVGYLRLVAANKSMYCVSFRLPREVAFRLPQKPTKEEKELESKKSIWLKTADDDTSTNSSEPPKLLES